ncbi:MAG: hypothetical protein JNK79_03540 [Chitinophagaceae bacterium]|nr:hypothetical protein [Chitinophagaceae bacterium]
MKKVGTILSIVAILAFAACGDSSENTNGTEQVSDPVNNSGPGTEAERANNAVKDSANAGADSTIRRDADAPSTPH